MDAHSSEGIVGRSVSTRMNCKTRKVSSDSLHDDMSIPLPPTVGIMVPISATGRITRNEPLTAQEQNPVQGGIPSSFRDNDISDEVTDMAGLRNWKSSIRSARSSSAGGKKMRRFSADNDNPSENTALLTGGNVHASQNTSMDRSTSNYWDENEGKVETTWKTEFFVLIKYSLPLMLTCILQYSLSGASVIAVGHLGRTELGAVSLAIMTSNVTGYCAYAGLATSLDTLCAQAYGSGKPHLVGLHLQRTVYFLWIITIPIAAVWLSGTQILLLITPEPESAELAGLFLKVLVVGAPGFALFEAGKRFVQAQGLFNANLYVLLICAPLNAFMNWLFVWVRKPVRSS
jgi:multidrug resistance protein, MATE family